MSTWYKDGVRFNLIPQAAEEFRQIKKLYSLRNEDLFITSGNDSTHSIGSFHYTDRAVDFRKGNNVKLLEIKTVLDKNKSQIIEEGDHYHYEYDPE